MLRHHARSNTRAILISGTTALAAFMLASCQSSSGSQSSATLSSAAQPQQAAANADDTMAAPQAVDPDTAQVSTEAAAPADASSSELALASTPAQSPAAMAACSITLAGGPPPKPAKGADFGSAVAKNTGKAVQRSVIQNIAGRFGGGLGAAVGGAVASSTIRNEEDIKGIWKITDGRPNCACEISVDSAWKLQGKGNDAGSSLKRGCTNPLVNRVANWALGYSFAGYGAKFELKAADKKTVLATMNRDGIHYFSGTLADGTPVVMWREGQNYNQLGAFKKTAK